MSKVTQKDKLEDAFLLLGAQYYVLARYSANAFLKPICPICGNLYHHAVEMLVKGCLVRTVDMGKLKKLGHKLIDLWETLTTQSGDSAGLNAFDHVIARLDKFEEIRYPEKLISDDLSIEIGKGPGPSLSSTLLGSPAKFELEIEEMDDLVSAIFRLSPSGPNAYFRNLPDDLTRDIPSDLLKNHQ